MEYIYPVLKIGAAVYAGLCALVFFRQGKFVYYPHREITATPTAIGVAYEDVALETEDGETIAAWYVPAADTNAKYTVLFCHGNGGNLSHRVESVRTFHRLGVNVLAFDYRGYGKSTGKPNEKGTYRDALAAWNHLVGERGIPPEGIVFFGRSLGGAVAAWLATQKQPAALAVESAFTSAPDMGKRMFPYLPIRMLSRYRYNTLKRLPDIRCPILIAHSRQDQTIPFSHGERLYEAAREPKTFVAFDGGHNDGGMDTNPRYQQRFSVFLSEL